MTRTLAWVERNTVEDPVAIQSERSDGRDRTSVAGIRHAGAVTKKPTSVSLWARPPKQAVRRTQHPTHRNGEGPESYGVSSALPDKKP